LQLAVTPLNRPANTGRGFDAAPAGSEADNRTTVAEVRETELSRRWTLPPDLS
jgi:hypothetical protein